MESAKKTKSRRTKVSSDSDLGGIAPTKSADDILDAWDKAAWKARESWLAKPRLHTAVFEKFLERGLSIEPPDKAFPSSEIKEAFYKQRRELFENIEGEKKRLGWNDERMKQFATLAVDFRKDPSIEQYLRIRKSFPELDIQIDISGGIDALFAIEKKCEQYGVDPGLVADAMDGSERHIDTLCLVLMDRLVTRGKIAGAGALQRKRAAISDAMVNYLIAFMLEGADRTDEEIRLPASLILLIRHQLGALKGDLHESFESRETKLRAAWIAGQQLKPGEPLSINRLMKLMTIIPKFTVSRATAARWLKDEEFRSHLELARAMKNFPEKFDLRRLTKKRVRDTP